MEFDEFMKIEGCKEKKRHLFIGKGKKAGEERVSEVRYVYLFHVNYAFLLYLTLTRDVFTATISTKPDRK